MQETCIGRHGPISLGVEKTKNFDQVWPPGLRGQNGPNFYRPIFPIFDCPRVGGLPYMLETCRRPKWTQIFYRPVFPIFDAP